ncbi:hypothetical protein ACFLYB_00025 [Chloroflexota bacterium]
MKDIAELLKRCHILGAILTPLNGNIKVNAPKPLPDDLISQLKEVKAQVLVELNSKEQLSEAPCPVLDEWRKVAIPDWRRVLRESISRKDISREQYARWMLREVLKDPDYQEAN